MEVHMKNTGNVLKCCYDLYDDGFNDKCYGNFI